MYLLKNIYQASITYQTLYPDALVTETETPVFLKVAPSGAQRMTANSQGYNVPEQEQEV